MLPEALWRRWLRRGSSPQPQLIDEPVLCLQLLRGSLLDLAPNSHVQRTAPVKRRLPGDNPGTPAALDGPQRLLQLAHVPNKDCVSVDVTQPVIMLTDVLLEHVTS